MTQLVEKKCVPCEGNVPTLSMDKAKKLLLELNNWSLDETHQEIFKKFTFKNFHQTMEFANAVAWLANKENHHPDMKLSYNQCIIHYKTHAINGLSENDFICAAKIDSLTNI